LREARRVRENHGLGFELEVEGGVGLANAKDLVRAGADILVVGSAIFIKDDLGGPLREVIDLTSGVEATTGQAAVLPVHEGRFESS
jgi:ribulose-phosphate 3-epimerase